METRSPSALATEWIQRWSTPQASSTAPVETAALDDALPKEQPELCLAAIIEVLGRLDASSSSHLLGVLAAGPLEDLLSHNADAVIAEVELLARRDPGFRRLLNGVWDSGIRPDILARLAKYRVAAW